MTVQPFYCSVMYVKAIAKNNPAAVKADFHYAAGVIIFLVY